MYSINTPILCLSPFTSAFPYLPSYLSYFPTLHSSIPYLPTLPIYLFLLAEGIPYRVNMIKGLEAPLRPSTVTLGEMPIITVDASSPNHLVMHPSPSTTSMSLMSVSSSMSTLGASLPPLPRPSSHSSPVSSSAVGAPSPASSHSIPALSSLSWAESLYAPQHRTMRSNAMPTRASLDLIELNKQISAAKEAAREAKTNNSTSPASVSTSLKHGKRQLTARGTDSTTTTTTTTATTTTAVSPALNTVRSGRKPTSAISQLPASVVEFIAAPAIPRDTSLPLIESAALLRWNSEQLAKDELSRNAFDASMSMIHAREACAANADKAPENELPVACVAAVLTKGIMDQASGQQQQQQQQQQQRNFHDDSDVNNSGFAGHGHVLRNANAKSRAVRARNVLSDIHKHTPDVATFSMSKYLKERGVSFTSSSASHVTTSQSASTLGYTLSTARVPSRGGASSSSSSSLSYSTSTTTGHRGGPLVPKTTLTSISVLMATELDEPM